MSYPAFVAHDPKHVEPHQEQPRRNALTTVPDLRFEYGFLKSVRPYFGLRPKSASDAKGKGKEDETLSGPSEVLEIQWRHVAWVTTRDQFLSPLAQGALWAIAGYFLTPLYANISGQARSFIPSPPEGGIAKWLRGWVQSFGTSSSSTPQTSKLYTRP
ncbi:hypothetical protein C8J57DRAFT_1067762 [Mycena rebaudengoi]|nr:hypothetical protein C8J57DRAFT_1067762 [Mycena rebaudengoi]